ncbi:MAG TPA: HisA/HisF-related TIM barrel protein [Acidimicrobiia bacterium]|jgi:phosphoribosylformimino-5-aminoimidazole carboxamide ribotide isomerase
MALYARVNILGGNSVRLPRGDASNAVVLDHDPIGRANAWVEKGAHKLFVVDLDAAIRGDHENRPLIEDLIDSTETPVVVAGGIRSRSEVDRLLKAGAWRVTMGTAAIVDQVLTWDLCREYSGSIMISLDVKPDEELVYRGWTEGSGRYLEEVLAEMSAAGAAGFMVAEAGRDALEEPPNHDALRMALSVATESEEVVAAGGVRHLDDLRELVALEVDGKRLGGVVVGREVTAGRFTLEEAAAILAG